MRNLLRLQIEDYIFEMGLNCELKHCFNFIYKADLENGLIEHEYDHVFIGYSDIHPNFNKK